MQLPLNLLLGLTQTRWASILNPVIANPLTGANIINGVVLSAGTNVINHGLGSLQQGWFYSDINGASSIYRNAPFNETTLSLHSSAIVTINLVVF